MRVREVTDIRVVLAEWEAQPLAVGSGRPGMGWPGMSYTLLSLPASKTGENQSVRVRRLEVQGMLDLWVRYVLTHGGENPDSRLFPDGPTFRRLFYDAQVRLGWADEDGGVPFVPHSLRHGGASCDDLHLGHGHLEDILFRGRWVSMKSTRHYIQQGPALMAAISTRVPRWQREYGHHVARAIWAFVRIPDEL